MRIGLVCPYNITKGGGVQEVVHALSRELEKRGHYVRIITPTPRSQTEDANNPKVIFIGKAKDIRSPFHTTAQISYEADNGAVEAVLEKNQFDLLHFHEPWVPLLGRQILTKNKSLNIATFHAKLPDTVMSRTIERVITPYTKPMMKYFDGLTAVSPAAAKYVQTITRQDVAIIPNGINAENFKISKDKKRLGLHILYVGRLEKRKGVKYLLDAFADLKTKHPRARLTIAGDGPDRFKLEYYANEKRIKNVDFKGFVSEKEKVRLLEACDLFCSPALYGESFGIVLLEAMASQTPIVAGNNMGYTDVLKGEGALSIINPSDTEEFSRRLELLLMSGPVRKIWKEWAKTEVKKYAYHNIADQYEQFYKKLLK